MNQQKERDNEISSERRVDAKLIDEKRKEKPSNMCAHAHERPLALIKSWNILFQFQIPWIGRRAP